jgi:TctA family transporter
LLYPTIILFCAIGVFSLSNSNFDVYLLAVFSLLGFIFIKLDAEPAPLLLAFVLGPMMEEFLRRALLISRGDPVVLISRPVSAAMLLAAAALLIMIITPALRRTREQAFQEEH